MARDLGASVMDTHGVGGGFPDFVMAVNGTTWLVEVKSGNAIPSARRLTDAERKFAGAWRDPDHHIVVGCRWCVAKMFHGDGVLCACEIKGPVRAVDYDRRPK